MGQRADRTKASAGQILVVLLAALVLLGGGAVVASASTAGSPEATTSSTTVAADPTASSTTAPAAGAAEQTTTTAASKAPTCDEVSALVAAELWTRAVAAFDAAVAANVACEPSIVAAARAVVDENTEALAAAVQVRRDGDEHAARALLVEARSRDVTDGRVTAAIAELDDAERDLRVIEELEAAGFETEAESALKAFVAEHPDAVVPSGVADLNRAPLPDRISEGGRSWALVVVPAIVLVLVLVAFARTALARWSKKRIVLAPITPIATAARRPEATAKPTAPPPSGAVGASAASKKAEKAEKKEGKDPAKDEVQEVQTIALSPSLIEALVVEQMQQFRTESTSPNPTMASGPDGAIDLPAPDKLPSQFAPISALSLLLPSARSYSLVASLTDAPDASILSLRLVQGRPEHGKLKAATTVGSSADSSQGRERELASKAAAWIAFTWSAERNVDPPLRMGGTANWVSYAHFASGLSWRLQGNRAKAIESYTQALRRDAGNVNALVNLAELEVEDHPALAIRFGMRALRALGDEWGAPAAPRLCCDTYVWHHNWYRATSHVVTAVLTHRQTTCKPTAELGREPVREALAAADRAIATIGAIQATGGPARWTLPAGVSSLGSGFLEFLEHVELNLQVLRVVALVELGSAEEEIDAAALALPPLHPHASFNLACALARSPLERHRSDALGHLAEAKLAFGASVADEEALRPLRRSHPREWEELFPTGLASGRARAQPGRARELIARGRGRR